MDATQYVYLSEIFPTHLRSQGVAVGMFSYFVATIILLVAGPIAMDNIGWRFMLVFAVPTCCYWFAIYLYLPSPLLIISTQGLTRIQAYFRKLPAVLWRILMSDLAILLL
jgi:MFS family permease